MSYFSAAAPTTREPMPPVDSRQQCQMQFISRLFVKTLFINETEFKLYSTKAKKMERWSILPASENMQQQWFTSVDQ